MRALIVWLVESGTLDRELAGALLFRILRALLGPGDAQPTGEGGRAT